MRETYEYCSVCDSETGKAGTEEDSLYVNDEGPFCKNCYARRWQDELLEAAKDAYRLISDDYAQNSTTLKLRKSPSGLPANFGIANKIKEKLRAAIAECE